MSERTSETITANVDEKLFRDHLVPLLKRPFMDDAASVPLGSIPPFAARSLNDWYGPEVDHA